MDIVTFLCLGKVHVLRISWKIMKQPQTGASIKGRMLEESSSMQPRKGYPLHHFLFYVRRGCPTLFCIRGHHLVINCHRFKIFIRLFNMFSFRPDLAHASIMLTSNVASSSISKRMSSSKYRHKPLTDCCGK